MSRLSLDLRYPSLSHLHPPSGPTTHPAAGHHSKAKTTEAHVDKRHGDPEMGGLTSGEKAALSRGQTPKSVKEDETGEKAKAAERYLKEKAKK